MPTLTCELILTLDAFARGTRSPGFYGYGGPEFLAWMEAGDARPHRQVMGRKTFDVLNDLPDEAKDEPWRAMTRRPGYVFSRKLREADWPGLEVVSDDPVEFIRARKADGGADLKTAGSLSLVRLFVEAGLVDVVRVILCPLVLPRTGAEPAFKGWPDASFDLLSTELLDGRVLVLDYRPAGPPPTTD